MPRHTGASDLRVLARDLKVAGSVGRGIRADLRRELIIAAKPIEAEVKKNARAIAVADSTPHGWNLRREIANATRTSIKLYGAQTWIRVMTDGRRMSGTGRGTLPAYMEGNDGYGGKNWRHPVFGNESKWVPQESHPYFAPAVKPHLIHVYEAIDIAVERTVARLTR